MLNSGTIQKKSKMMSLEELCSLKIFQEIEHLKVIPSKLMSLKIQRLPIPVLLKTQMHSLSKQWKLKPVLTRLNFKLTTVVRIPREVQFDICGFYGVCGFFYYQDLKVLIELTQHEFEEISVWFIGTLDVHSQKDFLQEVCLMLGNVGMAISPRDFQRDVQAESLIKWIGKLTFVSWKGTTNNTIFESILKLRNSSIQQRDPAQVFSELSVATGDDIHTAITLLDGLSCSDAATLQNAFDVSDEHPFTTILHVASECDMM